MAAKWQDLVYDIRVSSCFDAYLYRMQKPLINGVKGYYLAFWLTLLTGKVFSLR